MAHVEKLLNMPTADGLNEVVAGGSVLTGGSFINLTQREQGILKLNCGMAFWELKSVKLSSLMHISTRN